MKTTRREFVKISTLAGAAALFWRERLYATFAQSPALLKFGPGQRLRLFGIDIPLATPNTTTYAGVDYYQIAMRQFTDTLHPALGPTTLRGYTNAANSGSQKHLEGAILAQVNRPVRIKWVNELPAAIPLPVDPTLVEPFSCGENLTSDRVAPHLHGGLVPWPSDGGPFHWFSNGGMTKGPSVPDPWLPDAYGNPKASDDYWYPNIQSARFMWYHDHAVGITRLNPYLGLASGYILTDANEGLLPFAGRTLMKMLGIPEGDLTRQVHLVIQDKIFGATNYNSGPSDLWYPDFYDSQFFGAPAKGSSPLPTPSLVPEFWGDTMLVNGTVFPYIDVEPRRYRFRILNACNTRFMRLRLASSQGRPFPLNAEPDLAKVVPSITLIGTEGGFLDGTLAPKGVVYNTAVTPLVLAPAERADIIIDFSPLANAATQSKNQGPLCMLLHNDAPVPFPGGTSLADFHPANTKLPLPPVPGYGPNTRTLLQFRIFPLGALTSNPNPDPAPDPAWVLPPSPSPAGTVSTTRDLALYETVDEYGRLAQNLGPLTGPLGYMDTPTETVQSNTLEVWRVFNITADTHPIHFHFFNVRVLSRQPFSWRGGMPNLSGQLLPADPAELGWKETVKMNPGECTTMLVELPSTSGLAPAGVTIPESPRTGGHEYVWHCHILEHEEHDMMRPLIVT